MRSERRECRSTKRSSGCIVSGTGAGPPTFDSAIYSPRPDPFTPRVLTRDSSGSWDEIGYPCNARVRRVTVIDSANQFPARGDYGLGTIEIVAVSNMPPPTIIS